MVGAGDGTEAKVRGKLLIVSKQKQDIRYLVVASNLEACRRGLIAAPGIG